MQYCSKWNNTEGKLSHYKRIIIDCNTSCRIQKNTNHMLVLLKRQQNAEDLIFFLERESNIKTWHWKQVLSYFYKSSVACQGCRSVSWEVACAATFYKFSSSWPHLSPVRFVSTNISVRIPATLFFSLFVAVLKLYPSSVHYVHTAGEQLWNFNANWSQRSSVDTGVLPQALALTWMPRDFG